MQLHPLNSLCNNSSLAQFSPSVPSLSFLFSLLSLLFFASPPSSSSSSSFFCFSLSSLYLSLSCSTPQYLLLIPLNLKHEPPSLPLSNPNRLLYRKRVVLAQNRSQTSLPPGAFLGFFVRSNFSLNQVLAKTKKEREEEVGF